MFTSRGGWAFHMQFKALYGAEVGLNYDERALLSELDRLCMYEGQKGVRPSWYGELQSRELVISYRKFAADLGMSYGKFYRLLTSLRQKGVIKVLRSSRAPGGGTLLYVCQPDDLPALRERRIGVIDQLINRLTIEYPKGIPAKLERGWIRLHQLLDQLRNWSSPGFNRQLELLREEAESENGSVYSKTYNSSLEHDAVDKSENRVDNAGKEAKTDGFSPLSNILTNLQCLDAGLHNIYNQHTLVGYPSLSGDSIAENSKGTFKDHTPASPAKNENQKGTSHYTPEMTTTAGEMARISRLRASGVGAEVASGSTSMSSTKHLTVYERERLRGKALTRSERWLPPQDSVLYPSERNAHKELIRREDAVFVVKGLEWIEKYNLEHPDAPICRPFFWLNAGNIEKVRSVLLADAAAVEAAEAVKKAEAARASAAQFKIELETPLEAYAAAGSANGKNANAHKRKKG